MKEQDQEAAVKNEQDELRKKLLAELDEEDILPIEIAQEDYPF